VTQEQAPRSGRNWPVLLIAWAVVLLLLVAMAGDMGTRLFLNLTVSGVATGGILALSGMGIVLTFKATGVFNFAHGAMAMFVGYVLWQLQQIWQLPLVIAAPLALLVVGPAIGIALERVVFRPLERRSATTAEKLVATLGVFVLFVGAATAIWGTDTQRPVQLFSDAPVHFLGLTIGIDQFGIVVIVGVVSALLYYLFGRTHLGIEIRAVVSPVPVSVTAIMSRLIPNDEYGPGALEAGAMNYLDRALGGFLSEQREAYLAVLATAGGAVFLAWAHRRLIALPALAASGTDQGAGMARIAGILPFAAVAIATFVPLAAGIYLATTTAWSLGERLILRRIVGT
jgi:hypothetical protein